MFKKEELEIELSKAKLKREKSYELRERFDKEIDVLSDSYERRIRRIEQQMSSVSMSEKDRVEYGNRRLDALNRCLEFEESVENLKKEINKQCDDSENEVHELENMIADDYDEELDNGEQVIEDFDDSDDINDINGESLLGDNIKS